MTVTLLGNENACELLEDNPWSDELISLQRAQWRAGSLPRLAQQLRGYEFDGAIDEVRIWDRALTFDEIKASYDAGINRLERNFTELGEGSEVNYTAYVVDMAGNLNSTSYRNFSVNWVPNVSNMVIDGDDVGNYTDENITVTYDSDDGDSDVVKNITNWYLDGVSVMVLNMPFEAVDSQNESSWVKDYTNFSNQF